MAMLLYVTSSRRCSDREKAEIFFTSILEIPKVKSFSLTADLSDAIFSLRRPVEIDVYDNGSIAIEVFITGENKPPGFEHTCIEVKNIPKLIERCKQYGLTPSTIKKGEKDLLFIKDFSGNVYEIKEQQTT